MTSVFKQYETNTHAGHDHKAADDLPGQAPATYPIRAIAFYLPQFHAIAENDAWWGTGFTEWSNVTKAMPRYVGHRQPRLPSDLGFYDLSKVEILRRQADLVRRSGVYGLCIHDYWFDGRKVLETPLRLLLEHSDIDLRFCLNWANENWTRRWDGSESDILLEQRYDRANRNGYARSILPAIRDPRYIRIDGRPLILVYRPGILPDARDIFASWRSFFRDQGERDPYLVMVNSFDDFDPRPYGLDAAAGFPPHNSGTWDRNDRNRLRWLDPAYEGHARSYASLAAGALRNEPSDYRLFPGVSPSWDNEARKPRRGVSFYNASPAAFEAWLYQAASRAAGAACEDERLVFINAWNEWAEGAVLEPDRHYGYAHLVAVRNVIDRLAGERAAAAEPGRLDRHAATRPSAFNLVRNRAADLVRRVRARLT